MTTTYYVDGTAGSDTTGDGSSGNPYQTIAKCANGSGSFVNDDILIYCVAGTTITANTPTNAAFSTVSGRNLTLRATGGGARPEITCSNRGFRCLGTGSMDIQDVNITGGSVGTAAEALQGGGMRLVNTALRGFGVTVRCGSGVIYLYNATVDKPSQNGLKVDANFDQPIATSVQILDSTFIAASPTQQDLLVLHDGGYGVLTGAIIDGCRIEALGTAFIESGIDIQQQFKGTIVRNCEVIGASQWGFVMGSLFKGGASSYTFNTKAQMLAAFSRENTTASGSGVGTGSTIINGGHCAWVTADGGNNGLYQLTGSDPQLSGSWTGPIDAGDMAANPNLIYSNLIQGCRAGIQVQHPGSQIVANRVLDVTGGNWWSGDAGSLGAGNPISLQEMAYDCKVMDNVFSTTNSKYAEIGTGGGETGRLLSSTRAAVQVKALPSHIAPRTRAVFTGNVVRQRAEHLGPFVEFLDAADLGYLESNNNAWIADSGVSNATWPEFCDPDGASLTYTGFKTANDNSDANSLWQTPTTAVIDTDCRPSDGSTLIAAGTARVGLDVGIPAVDSEGNAISSPPDIGAYAYVSEAAQASVAGTGRRLLRSVRTPGTPPVDADPPGTPTGLTNDSATASTLTMSWAEVETATFYELRYAISGEASWTVEESTTYTGATISGLSASTSYDVQVRASNGAGTSDWSATVMASTS